MTDPRHHGGLLLASSPGEGLLGEAEAHPRSQGRRVLEGVGSCTAELKGQGPRGTAREEAFREWGPGEAAAPGCAPQRRKPGTAPSLCVGPRFGGTAAPLNPLRSKGEGEVCPRVSDKNRLQWKIAPASSPAGRVSEVTEGTWRGRPCGGVPPWSGGLRVSDEEDFSPLETPLRLRCPSGSLLPKQSVNSLNLFPLPPPAQDLSSPPRTQRQESP